MPQGKFYDQEDFNSHELSSTHYQPYQHPSQNQNQNSSRSRDQNAFGDDSDSEEDQPRHEPLVEDDAPPEFDVYKDFNNSGVRYTTLLHGATDESKLDREDLNHPNQFSNIQSPIKSEKSRQNRDEDYSTIDEHLSPNPSQSRFQVDQPALASPSKPKNKLAQLKNSKNRWKIGSIIAFVAIACFGVVVFFLIPRQPFISFEAPPKLSKKEDNHLIFSASKPTNFYFDAQLDLSLDGRSSYLPTLIRGFKVTINDIGATPDSVRVATGNLDQGFTTSTKKPTPLTLDVHFEYDAKLPSDTLWQTWRKACGNVAESTVNGTITRPSVQLFLLLEFNVLGMFSTRYDSTQLTNVGCPAELPAGAPSF